MYTPSERADVFHSLQFEVLEDRNMLSASGALPVVPILLPLPVQPALVQTVVNSVNTLETSLVSTVNDTLTSSVNNLTPVLPVVSTPIGSIPTQGQGNGGGLVPILPGTPIVTLPGSPLPGTSTPTLPGTPTSSTPAGPFSSTQGSSGSVPTSTDTQSGLNNTGEGSSVLSNTVFPFDSVQPFATGQSVALFLESAPFTLPASEIHPVGNVFGNTTGFGASEALIAPTGSAPLFGNSSLDQSEQVAEVNNNNQNTPSLTQPNTTAPSPGLLSESAPMDMDRLEAALQQFLDEFVDIGSSVTGWVQDQGALPWLLMTVAVGMTLHEVVRQRLQKEDGKTTSQVDRGRWFSGPQGPVH
jgi:hypothetical protein